MLIWFAWLERTWQPDWASTKKRFALESTMPSIFPCPPPNNCQGRQPGYIIRLRVNDLVYEYNGKTSGQLRILWYEAPDAPAL